MTHPIVLHAGWILPGDSTLPVLTNNALVIENTTILDILPSDAARTQYANAQHMDLSEHVLMPGMINTHTHSPMNLLRGIADDLGLMTWLQEHIWPREQKWVSAEFVKFGSQLAIAEMLRSGTTCFNDMYFFPGATAEAVVESGIRASLGMNILEIPTAYASTADESIEKGLAAYNQFKGESRIQFAVAPHAIYTISDETFGKVRTLADEYDMRIHIHVHETKDEINQSVAQTQKRPLKRLQEMGIASPRMLAVHMTQITPEDLAIMGECGAHVVHCPESNMKLASGYCPVGAFQEAGINVALGTDGAASNNDLDMLTEMRSAAMLAKLHTHNPESLPALKAIEMATLNGAKALGLDNITGSLVKGKQADIVAVNMNTLETQPMFHPESNIVYNANRSQVSDVWVAGQRVLKDNRLTTLDESAIISTAKQWQAKLAQ